MKHSIPEHKHGTCRVMMQGEFDSVLEALPIGKEDDEYGTMLTIASNEGAIYVTKDQAKAFFDLTERESKDKEINDRLLMFYASVRPRLAMSELQLLAAFCIYLQSGDPADIPGSEQNRERAYKG